MAVTRWREGSAVDAYLEIAATVLRAERRPLSPRAILAAAYRRGMVPPHLHGQTQHKTLQARISEDIIARREQSAFFRTAPGRFFLREFLTDTSLPEDFRRPVPTRRRFRELVRGPALAFDADVLGTLAHENTPIAPHRIFGLLGRDCFRYDDPRSKSTKNVFVRSFVCVVRRRNVLTYRLGRYREDRDSFVSRRSIGFSTLVHRDEHTLFNMADFGIVDSGVRATTVDLDIPAVPPSEHIHASLRYFTWVRKEAGLNDLLAVVAFKCPEWFEPVKRRLALNDLAWLDVTQPVNNIEDFDPWSKHVLEIFYANASHDLEDHPEHSVPRHPQRRISEVSARDR
jgi:hypothetical protein